MPTVALAIIAGFIGIVLFAGGATAPLFVGPIPETEESTRFNSTLMGIGVILLILACAIYGLGELI